MSRPSFLKAVRPAILLRRFRRNAEGVAAVEFGFIAPVMLLMLMGVIEVSRAITIDRRLGLATSMIADLVAREEGVPSTELTAIYNIVQKVMGPYDNTTFQVKVIPVMAKDDDETDTKVYAQPVAYGTGVTRPAKGSSYTLDDGLVGEGGSVVVVETSYKYFPIFFSYVTNVMKWSGSSAGGWTWTDSATASPRKGNCVAFEDLNSDGKYSGPDCTEAYEDTFP
ncbi:MAG: TadE/TadG family type IV pilus assembly protein [Hyphomicrobium sp.]